MSVYTELLRVGVTEDTAREIDAAVHRSSSIVTRDVLDASLAQLEARLTRTIMTTMLGMTGIFAAFVAAMMAWVVR